MKQLDNFIYFLLLNHLPASKIKEIIQEVKSSNIEDLKLYEYAKNISTELGSEENLQTDVILNLAELTETQEDRLYNGKEAIEELVKTGQMTQEEATTILNDIQEFDGRLPK